MKRMNEKLARIMTLIGFMLVFSGCGSTKEPLSAEAWSQMENLMTSQNLMFVAAWAEPIGGSGRVSQIDLSGSVNYMKMQGENVQMELPYFGASQVARMGGADQGFRFESTATGISSRKNEKQNFYDLDFTVRNKSESLSCSLRLYSGERAVLTINSSQRNSIRYEGQVRALD